MLRVVAKYSILFVSTVLLVFGSSVTAMISPRLRLLCEGATSLKHKLQNVTIIRMVIINIVNAETLSPHAVKAVLASRPSWSGF